VQNTLEQLRERPKHEKRAIALWVSIAVMIVLFAGWAIYFVHGLSAGSTPVQNPNAADTTSLQQAAQQVQQAFSSSTQFIQTSQGVQIEEVGSTTETTTQ